MNKEERSEQELIQKLRQGDESSYAFIMRKYGLRLLSVSLRYTNNYEDAKDCVQKTFTQVFRSINKFEERSSLWTWLRRIVINFSIQSAQKKNKGQEVSIDDILPIFDSEDCRHEPNWDFSEPIDAILERKESIDTIRAAIDRLPVDYRIVLVLKDIDGYTIKEIAEFTQLEISNVKSRLDRARKALKKLLKPLMKSK